MNKRLLTLICILVQVFTMHAQEPDSTVRVSAGTFDLYPVLNPWLGTTNPAGMHFNPGVEISDLSLNYSSASGEYRRPQEGDSLQNYYLSTSSYKRIRNTWFFGSFSYEKSYERNCNFNLVNNPFRQTPYLLIDTLGRNDVYDREFFNLRGDLATPVGDHFSYGLSVNMDVGLASQDRDPRPRNKVMNLDASPGILFHAGGISLGINMLYSYYNEDIEVDVIEENVQHAFFQLHGFDTYTYHVAASFNRLYQRTTYGGEGQLGVQAGGLNSIFGAKFVYMDETADDGRRAGDASWSYIKNDSRLTGNMLRIFNTSTFSHGDFHHHLDASYSIRDQLGAEYLQRLEQVGEAGAVDWVNYRLEEKYAAIYQNVDLGYSFIVMKDEYLPGMEVSLKLAYEEKEHTYDYPDLGETYRNRHFSARLKKNFYDGKDEFGIAGGVSYKKNLEADRHREVYDHYASENGQQLGEENFITDLLLYPDFAYYTQNTSSLWVSISYARQMNWLFEKYFATIHLGSVDAGHAIIRKQFHIKTGLIF